MQLNAISTLYNHEKVTWAYENFKQSLLSEKDIYLPRL